MSFKRQLLIYKRAIDRALASYFRKKLSSTKVYGAAPLSLARALSEYTQRAGAKRVRGVLVLVGYRLFGGTRHSSIMNVALAMELIHSFLLVHDDIIDRDDLRRGGPTVHAYFERYYRTRFGHDAHHYGESLALLAGDLSYTWALQLIEQSSFEEAQKLTVYRYLTGNIERVIHGETLDVLGCQREQEIQNMNYLKTALYTFVNPLLVGALLAGASSRDQRILEQYSRQTGIAFQLRDDIIGLYGEEKIIGKNTASDIHERKTTMLIHHARQHATREQHARINRIWNKKTRITKQDIAFIRRFVRDSGSLAYNERVAQELVDTARVYLRRLRNARATHVRFLDRMAEYVIEREK